MGFPGLGAIGRFSYAAGASGTVTVPSGAVVVRVMALSVGGGSFTISPGGPNQTNPVVAGNSVPLPAGAWWSAEWAPGLSPLGNGTVFIFTSTDSYYVEYSTAKVGA